MCDGLRLGRQWRGRPVVGTLFFGFAIVVGNGNSRGEFLWLGFRDDFGFGGDAFFESLVL